MNHYFQFKQFTIQQEHCAMKVCTDACLFGAWLVELLQKEQRKINNNHFLLQASIPLSTTLSDCLYDPLSALDIGTGTGLLSLMLAQESNAAIDAIEIEPAAAKQASENIAASPFQQQIQIIEADIKLWEPHKSYDVIFSNPPFFENDLTSPDSKRNLALHSSELRLEELFAIMKRQIKETGIIAIILPFHRKEAALAFAKQPQLFLYSEANIQQTQKHPSFRTFLAFSPIEKTPFAEEIIIQQNGVYSDRFKSLLQKYYLAF